MTNHSFLHGSFQDSIFLGGVIGGVCFLNIMLNNT